MGLKKKKVRLEKNDKTSKITKEEKAECFIILQGTYPLIVKEEIIQARKAISEALLGGNIDTVFFGNMKRARKHLRNVIIKLKDWEGDIETVEKYFRKTIK